jgi:hypothetical protein
MYIIYYQNIYDKSLFYAVQYILIPTSVFFVVASVFYLVCLYAKYKIVKNFPNNICSLHIGTEYFNVFSRKKLTLLQTMHRLKVHKIEIFLASILKLVLFLY